MYVDFDGHHSGGSSLDMYMIFGFCYKMWATPTGTSSTFFKKKKSPSIWSRTPNSVRIRQSGRTGNRGVTSSLLTEEEKAQLQQALTANIDVFSWKHSNMTGVNPVNASQRLNVLPSSRPIRQKVRYFHLDRHQIIQAEVDNLLKAGFIREVKYPEWLANVVVVPKKGGKWRVCVDYTDLNDACPKDNFPLPRID